MIIAWRLVKSRHAANAFDGEGARFYGGRWNHEGAPAVYLSDSLALAALEQFIHLGTEGAHLSFVYFKVEVPDRVRVEILDPALLPPDWQREPPGAASKDLGARWLQKRSAALLKVPSALVPHGANYLLNPLRPDFGRIKIQQPEPFSFDPRMFK